MLNQEDKCKLRKEVNCHFQQGENWYFKGKTIDQKEKGMIEVLKGIRKLKLWIQRESGNRPVQDRLKIYLKQKIGEVKEWETSLKEKKQMIEEHQNTGNQVM